MVRLANWCFTSEACEGVETTPRDGAVFVFRNKQIKLVLGPIEEPDGNTNYPHRHGLISCLNSETLTKGQAIDFLKEQGLYSDGQYLHKIDSTKEKYVAYCFKSADGTASKAERAIKRAADTISSIHGLKVTPKRLRGELATQEGASFLARNKAVIDVYASTPELHQNKKKIVESIDKVDNMKNFMTAIVNFKTVIERAIKGNGIVTTSSYFRDSTRDDQISAVICIALLPTVAERKRITDGIPGLWFHGAAHCGKSFLFSQLPDYKKVATDAEGVSRFKLENTQTGYLIDDVDVGWINKPSNAKTMKALAVGERETIKTFGDTQEVRGFVVLTGNSLPDYLAPCPAVPEGTDPDTFQRSFAFNSAAWKRRFVAVSFTEACDFDFIYVDFDACSLDIIARKAFQTAYESIESDKLKHMLKPYYDNCVNVWSDEETELYNSVFDVLSDAE
jgi:hypothetical protein